MAKSFKERIKALEDKILSSKGAIQAVIDATKGDEGEDPRDFTDVEQETVDLGKSEIEAAQKSIATLKAAQVALGSKIGSPAVVKTVGAKERPLADMLIKQATCELLGFQKHMTPDAVANEIYQKDADAVEFVKAAAPYADTQTADWAKDLIQTSYGEFMEALRPMSVYAQIVAGGTSIPFGNNNSVTFPAEGATGGLAGQFVGEGNLIPVGAAQYTSIILNRYKLGIISNFTREILRSSVPSIEGLVRNSMLKDTANAIDLALLDNAAMQPNVRPAGLLNGVTATASAGNTVANIVTDLKALVSPILAKGGNLSGVTLVMNSEHLLGLSTVTTAAGTFAFRDEIQGGMLLGHKVISSTVVPKGKVIAVYAPALASSFDMPEFEVSNSAVIIQATNTAMDPAKPVVEDYDAGGALANAGTAGKAGATVGAAAGDTSATAPQITTAFQQDLIALRMIMPLSWGMRRDGMVTAISGVTW